jgi:hypothetical protein
MDQRIPGNGESRSGSDIRRHEGGRYKRSIYGINYPYIFPNNKEIVDKIPTVNFRERLYRSRWRSLPIVVRRPDLRFLGQHHQHPGQSHLKAGFLGKNRENDFDQINVSGVPGGTNNQNGRFEFRNTRPAARGSMLPMRPWAIQLVCRDRQPVLHAIPGAMYEWFIQDGWRVSQTAPGTGASSYDHSAVLQPLGQHGCL